MLLQNYSTNKNATAYSPLLQIGTRAHVRRDRLALRGHHRPHLAQRNPCGKPCSQNSKQRNSHFGNFVFAIPYIVD